MFNDLNNQNSRPNGAVDDIFAETDKANTGVSQSEIETRQVGLASAGGAAPSPHLDNNASMAVSAGDEMTRQMLSADQEAPRPANKGYLKVIIIVLVIIILGAAAYFAYLTLFSGDETEEPITAPIVQETPINTPVNNFVEVIPEEIANTINNEVAPEEIISEENTLASDIPPSTPLDNESSIENDFQNFVDSDGDGLSDDEEVLLETNPNLIDTDNDGLSDYEEVRIYLTNPLNADTDGDGYPDGEEVRAGYDPNAVGAKLPGNNR